MLSLSQFDAVIFDLDGLVLDTESTYFSAWQQAAKHMGYEFPLGFCQTFSGLHYQAIERKLLDFCGADFNLPWFSQLSGECWREFVGVHGISIKPGFNEFMGLLNQQGKPYALATNSAAANAYECLELAGLSGKFELIVSRDDVAQGKPDPEIFLQTAECLQVDIHRCLILEDSRSGIQAAVSAGAYAVYIPSNPVPDQQAAVQCNLTVTNLSELVDLMEC